MPIMKASELRIGNYVWEDYGGDYVVTSIHNKSFETIGLTKPSFKTEGVYLVDEIKPILLTEEWLLKFGFEKDLANEWFLQPKFEDEETNFCFYWEVDEIVLRDNYEDIFMTRVDQVHKMQNLYFALTGEELRIKE